MKRRYRGKSPVKAFLCRAAIICLCCSAVTASILLAAPRMDDAASAATLSTRQTDDPVSEIAKSPLQIVRKNFALNDWEGGCHNSVSGEYSFESSGDFEIVKAAQYNAEQIQNGDYLASGAGHAFGMAGDTILGDNANPNAVIGMNRCYVVTTKDIRYADEAATAVPGYYQITYPDAVIDADGNKYDFRIRVSNIQIANRKSLDQVDWDSLQDKRNITGPVALFHGGFVAYPTLKEGNASKGIDHPLGLDARGRTRFKYIGISQEITFTVLDKNGSVVNNKYYPIQWTDLDTKDYTYGTSASMNGPYVESVTVKNLTQATNDKLFYGSWLTVDTVSGGKRFRTNHATELDSNSEVSALTYRALSNNHTVTWTGGHCGTTFIPFDLHTVETEAIGSYAAHAHITATDTKILLKEDKKIEMSADRGYKITEVKYGKKGDTLTAASTTCNTDKTSCYFTIPDIVDDYKVTVKVMPLPGKVTIRHRIKGGPDTPAFGTTDTTYYGDYGSTKDDNGQTIVCQPATAAAAEANYELDSTSPSPVDCRITGLESDNATITYYYKKMQSSILLHFVEYDDHSHKLRQDASFTGEVGATKTIEPRLYSTLRGTDGKYYVLHDDSKNNITAQFIKGDVAEYTLYYVRSDCGITVHYIDYDKKDEPGDDKKLHEDVAVAGIKGAEFKPDVMEFEHYKYYDITPKQDNYYFSETEQEITIYYRRRASITVRYVDKETGRDIITSTYRDDGYDGEKGTCDVRDLPNWIFDSSSDEAECVFSEDGSEFIIYYRKNPNVPESPKTGASNPAVSVIAIALLGSIAAFGVYRVTKRR